MRFYKISLLLPTLLAVFMLLMSGLVSSSFAYHDSLTSKIQASATNPVGNDIYTVSPNDEILSWSSPLQVSGGYRGRGADVAMNSGEAQINYNNYFNPYDLLYEAASTDNGHSFGPGVFRGRPHDYLSGTGIRIAEDNQKYVYMVWRSSCQDPPTSQCSDADYKRAIFFAARDPDGVWSTPIDLSGDEKNDNGQSIAVGSDGVVHVVYVHSYGDPQNDPHTDSAIYYMNSTDHGVHWISRTTIQEGCSGQSNCTDQWTNQTAIAVDSANRPHVIYERGVKDEYSIVVRDFVNGFWQPYPKDKPRELFTYSTQNGRGYWPSAAANFHGGIGVVWQQTGNQSQQGIFYERWDPTTLQWSGIPIRVRPDLPTVPQSPALTYDLQDNAYITWVEGVSSSETDIDYTYELSPDHFVPYQSLFTNVSNNPQMASYNNNLLISFDYRPTFNVPMQVYTSWNHAPSYCSRQYFVDVACNYWAFNYIQWVSQQNILQGYAGTECAAALIAYPCYLPHQNVSRAEMAKTLYRAEGWTPYTPGTQSFTDVPPNHWAYTYIERAVHYNVISGEDQATCQAHNKAYPCFLPTETVSRAEISAFLYRAHHLLPYTPPSGQTFSDVPRTHWAFLYIETAAQHGIVTGFPDGNFQPAGNVSRDQAAKFIYKTYYTPNS